MEQVTQWLEDRRVGANMQPFRLVVTNDLTGGLRDWTVDRALAADQHTGTFTLYDSTGAAVIDAQALETLGADGELLYYATQAEADALAAGRYVAVFTVINESATATDYFVFGQRVLAVP